MQNLLCTCSMYHALFCVQEIEQWAKTKQNKTCPLSWRLYSSAMGAPSRERTHAEGCSKLGPGRKPEIMLGLPIEWTTQVMEVLRSQTGNKDATLRSEQHKATAVPKGWRDSHRGCHTKTRSQGCPAGAGTTMEAALWEQGPEGRSSPEGSGAAEELL